jgi:D-threo-aldose 1-dehydrogenase
LGNEFEFVGDEDAYQTLEAAWNAGVRYYDVAPWYGLGSRKGDLIARWARYQS